MLNEPLLAFLKAILVNIHTLISLLEIGIVRTECVFLSELFIFDRSFLYTPKIILMFCNVRWPSGYYATLLLSRKPYKLEFLFRFVTAFCHVFFSLC